MTRRLGGDRMRHRLLAFADPLVSSLSNALVFFLVARAFETPEPVGAFALAMIAYNLCVGTSRAVVGEVLMSKYSAASAEVRSTLVGQLQGTTLLVSVVGSAVLWATSEVLEGPSGRALAALAVVLPVLLIQDTWRFVFVIDRPGLAVVVDVAWLLVVVVALPLAPDDVGVAWYVLVWGMGAAVGAFVGLVLHRGFVGQLHPVRWLLENRHMAWRFFGDFIISRGVSELALVCLGAIAGLGALGAAKASLVFYGFLHTLHGGLTLAVIPEGVRISGQRRKLQRIVAVAATLLTAASVVWMVAGVLLPDSTGRFAFGSTWDEGEQLMLPMGLAMVARAVKHGGFLGLRSLADAERSFQVRLVSAPVEMIMPVVGAVAGGAVGFTVGFAISQVVAAGMWWLYFFRGLDDVEPKHLRRSDNRSVSESLPNDIEMDTVVYERSVSQSSEVG